MSLPIRCGRHPSLLLAVVFASAAATLAMPLGAASAAGCPNEAIRPELHSARLPDCRAYEMVSPPAKNGWPVEVASANGTRVAITSIGAFAGSDPRSIRGINNLPANGYLTERSPHGWSTAPFIEPPGLWDHSFLPALDMSADLGQGLFEYNLLSNPTPHEQNLYINDLPSGPPREVGPVFSHEALINNPTGGSPAKTSVSSASDGLATVVFEIEGPSKEEPEDYLWRPGDTTVKNTGPLYGVFGFLSLYEYRGTDNSAPQLVGVSDGKTVVNGKTLESGAMIGQCGVSLGFPKEGKFDETVAADAYNVISGDGSRVFFTVAKATQGPAEDACTGEGTGYGPPADELFAREARSQGFATVAISEPSPEECSACDTSNPADAVFQGASHDGSKVYFLSEQKLLAGAEGQSLYEYNFDAEAEGAPTGRRVTLIAPNVPGVARVSEDGSHVYFVSKDVLPSAPNPIGDAPQPGADNLYVAQGGHTAFVGTLSESDAVDWRQNDERPVETTPAGQFVVFDSSSDLTQEGTGGVRQVFEYHAGTNRPTLVRVSAGGGPDVYGAEIPEPNFSRFQNPAPKLGAVSDDGSVVAFQSADALVPRAMTGYPNVYEYHNGSLSLISDGQDRTDKEPLLGIDPSGDNLYFTTVDRLVPQDGDTQQDLYDARIDGGALPGAGPFECAGEGCQGSQATPPVLSAPASGTQLAEEKHGEPTAALTTPPRRPTTKKCKKGYVLRHSRCARRRHAQRSLLPSHRRGGN